MKYKELIQFDPIDEIIKSDFLNIYKKVKRNDKAKNLIDAQN